jgi:Ser/Thr protein kinase RdoA (MazF antagonist)
MGNIKYKMEFEDLCQTSLLGELVNDPKSISGGLLHRMYAIETTTGKYAVKLLNPQIMIRSTAMQNYINSEKISNFVSNKIPALPAEKINGDSIQKINGQFYLVFNWVDGISLKQDEIDNSHCEKIGEILADIHKTDFSELGIRNERTDNGQLTKWDHYLQKGKEERLEWVEMLHENLDNLKGWNILTKWLSFV